tara:strand:+ start:622 stop:810 length:189 start_codon:yes stop_codon:yes gene_type:complete
MSIEMAIITTLSYISVLGVIGLMINKSQRELEVNQHDLPKVNNDICWYSGLPSTSTYKENNK